MPNESSCSTFGLQPVGLAAAVRWKTVGMMSAMAANEREIPEVRAPLALKTCSLCFTPPNKAERPRTRRMLPMIEPVIEALTTPVSPFERAMPAMISSAAFPNVAFNNPPSQIEDEKDVADDRAGDRSFDHTGQSFRKSDARDDQFRGVSERRV